MKNHTNLRAKTGWGLILFCCAALFCGLPRVAHAQRPPRIGVPNFPTAHHP